MTDTLFLIGWRRAGIRIPELNVWTTLRWAHEEIPDEVLEWLADNEVNHSYGLLELAVIDPRASDDQRREGKFLVIHEIQQAVAFRMRWNAQPITLDEGRCLNTLRAKLMMPEWRYS